jgi:hypothetical protein
MKLGAVLHLYEHDRGLQLAKPDVIGLTTDLLLTHMGCVLREDDW